MQTCLPAGHMIECPKDLELIKSRKHVIRFPDPFPADYVLYVLPRVYTRAGQAGSDGRRGGGAER